MVTPSTFTHVYTKKCPLRNLGNYQKGTSGVIHKDLIDTKLDDFEGGLMTAFFEKKQALRIHIVIIGMDPFNIKILSL